MFYHATSFEGFLAYTTGNFIRGWDRNEGVFRPQELRQIETKSLGDVKPPMYTAYAPSLRSYAKQYFHSLAGYGDIALGFDENPTLVHQGDSGAHMSKAVFTPVKYGGRLDKKRMNSMFISQIRKYRSTGVWKTLSDSIFTEGQYWKELPPVRSIVVNANNKLTQEQKDVISRYVQKTKIPLYVIEKAVDEKNSKWVEKIYRI